MPVELASDVLEERCHRLLDGLNYMCLELLERVLHSYQVLTVVVLFNNLFTESMVDASLKNIGVVRRINFPSRRSKRRSVLAEKLDMLLRYVSCLVNTLRTFDSSSRQLLGLVFDFGMESFQKWENGAFDIFLSLEVGVCETLRIGANVFEQASNSAQALIEMVPLFQGARHRLKIVNVAPPGIVSNPAEKAENSL